ncbi:DUF167 family protein [Nitratireductor sp. GISD-1A_MAKvit]|uniref:DUF167 family protein n=1 Tax=Nitratireductor sp. GISD-1A_MAKvit TaxID=3234198 RepID=UPI00346630B1
MPSTPAFCKRFDGGVTLLVRLTPRSLRDAIEGAGQTADGREHLKARVRAVPENGKANAALEKLLAKALRVPASGVSVTTGITARLKTVEIRGDPHNLMVSLAALAGTQ